MTLDVDSLARGDSHMVARFLSAWNDARIERAHNITPAWSVAQAAEHLDQLAIAWTRHLLHEVGASTDREVRPTAAQRRALVRRLIADGATGDAGLELLTSWAAWLLWGEDEQARRHDFVKLAGDLDTTVLASVLNHVRRTRSEFNGRDLTIVVKPKAFDGE